MKILVTNNQLDKLGGTETFVFTIIEELLRIGHNVEYFTFRKGYVSSKIEQELRVSFMSENNYDLILANHNTTVEKVFKKGFTIQTCHGMFPKLEQPSLRANAYVSISQEVQDHLARLGFPSITIHNSINLKRFKSKTDINEEVKTILSLCHSEEANSFVKDVCFKKNLNFEQAYKYKNSVWDIEDKINKADLVIGLGRSAYEAMACGRPVVIYDNRRYFASCGDGYAKDILGFSIKNNCSGRYLNKSFTKDDLIKEIFKYDEDDSKFFREFAERELDVTKNILKYFDYAESILKRVKTKRRNKEIKIIKKIFGNKNFNWLIRLYKKCR